MSLNQLLCVGTAGWAIPRIVATEFPAEGSALARYAARFLATEVNSTFRKVHRPTTIERWASTAPDEFKFSVKAPERITHEKNLCQVDDDLSDFLQQIAPFGAKLGPLLFQLPPKLAFDEVSARRFFDQLRSTFAGLVALEPRHPSWFVDEVTACLTAYRIARVAADPARVPAAAEPGGWDGLNYLRLHGSPRMYYSAYGPAYVRSLAVRLSARRQDTWCIFDNTAAGAATADALSLLAAMREQQAPE